MRLGLAFRAFFAVLFARPLPPEIVPVAEALPPPKPEPTPAPPPPEPAPKPVEAKPAPEDPKRLEAAAVQVLALLQAEGRLLDFLSEDIESYADADIGAAVRDIHRGLKKALSDHFPVSPVRAEDEESMLTVPEGFDPSQIRLTGNVIGKPPFSGRLKHKGWKVTQVHLPRVPAGEAAMIVAPAEVEV
jgi:hypothetical protein